MLLDWMGIFDVQQSFHNRAINRIPRLGRMTTVIRKCSPSVLWLKTRVVSYVEYSFEAPSFKMKGEDVYENAEARESKWLRATQPPFSANADRRTCSEYHLFDSLCEGLSRAGCTSEAQRKELRGSVVVLVSAPPCVSCLGVARQFTILYPGVSL